MGCGATTAQSQAPHIFYSDLESGPNRGGKDNAGAFVTISGKRFGASAGPSAYVTVGGGRVSNYPCWSDTKICIQVGAAAASGPIVVTTAAGASNGVAFTVRTGRIFFVATTGKDS